MFFSRAVLDPSKLYAFLDGLVHGLVTVIEAIRILYG